ncbi:hypothetical protein [Bacillus cereus]|uniref:hypothetical protein n=1 Tax=Bacillus cereus TaxID=1396 RepID=UPI00039D6F82|nr:hypothetical protein [Bacillus cereus]
MNFIYFTIFQELDRFTYINPDATRCSHKACREIQLEYDFMCEELYEMEIELGKRSG